MRSQLERHTAQFLNSIRLSLSPDNSSSLPPTQNPNQAETDMQSLARQLTSIATGLELLPEYLRLEQMNKFKGAP